MTPINTPQPPDITRRKRNGADAKHRADAAHSHHPN